MKKKGNAPGFNAKWWTEECQELACHTREAGSVEEHTFLTTKLKRVIQTTKQRWADKYISSASIWEVTAWRHGHKSSHIPALWDTDGVMHSNHVSMAEMLTECFFMEEQDPIPTHFSDNPPLAHPDCSIP